MNSNYLTATKDYDYRFVSRVLMCVFEKSELLEGCIRINTARNTMTKYKTLDQTKFDFIKGNISIKFN